MPLLLIIFIVIPVIELSLFIKIGGLIGVIPTVMAVFASTAIGMMLIRQQGFSMIMRVRAKIEHGEVPANEVIEGFLLGLSGILLILPGFLTDFFGLICLPPFFRRYLARAIVRRGVVSGGAGGSFYFNAAASPNKKNTFEGEFSREEAPDTDDVPKLKKK